MSELTQRPFDFNEISSEAKQNIESINNSIYDIGGKDMDASTALALQAMKNLEQEKARQKELYPAHPPNDKCHEALLTGVSFSNETGLRLHDFIPYFTTKYEKAYIWTHTKNHNSSLVVDVDLAVKTQNVWRTLASILELTIAISHTFEHTIECNYDWIYNFDPKTSIENTEFLHLENLERYSGAQFRLSYLAKHASLIELFLRDERFYVMGMNLKSSFYNHHFCLICAFNQDGYQDHPNHEIPHWQVAQAIPNMEVAIVQATRAVEVVLGKPGKKRQRTLNRWESTIDLDPDALYELANESNIDYYYEMFGIRGDAAHSLGSFPYEFSRVLTINAQCFAWKVLVSYFNRYALNNEQALEVLGFNMEIISREPNDISTILTADSDDFPQQRGPET